jgi:hypothetical protein
MFGIHPSGFYITRIFTAQTGSKQRSAWCLLVVT